MKKQNMNSTSENTLYSYTSGATESRAVAYWLFGVAFMVFSMVVLGGVTRLTHSGLSMVEWRPITGWLPPMSEALWQEVFAKYREFPEYIERNAGMTLTEFKSIFWLEFLHRLWGRIIGLAFFIPFVFFLVKSWVRGPLTAHMVALFVLGGLQGGLGWFMVKSGLVDRPDVSQYRLAAHLCLALLIFGYLIWVGLSVMTKPGSATIVPKAKYVSLGLVGLIFVTAFSGALVAGLDAGLTYNTFPLMDGELVPGGLLDMSPWYLNFFESILTVQFDHRVLAITTFVCVISMWIWAAKQDLSGNQKRAVNALLVMVVVQLSLGIATLLLVVPVTLGALHQAGAVILLGLSVWAAFSFRR
jgi:cytochrome c oxidase assembly protein subunit 15